MTSRRDPVVHRGVIAGAAAVAFVMRVAYFFDHRPALFAITDNTWYVGVARSIATGHGGRLPAVTGGRAWSFRFPPAYPAALAIGQRALFWVRPFDADLWTSAALGAVAAGVVAALAWRLCARDSFPLRATVAATAGLLLALNPLVAGASAALMSEALYVLAVALALVLIDRVLTEPSGRAGTLALGLAFGLVALTRSEGVVLVVGLTVGALVVARRRRVRARRVIAALGIGLLFPIGWSAFATSVSGRPVSVATNTGSLLLGSTCPLLNHDDAVGYWAINCKLKIVQSPRTNERFVAAAQVASKHLFTLAPVPGPESDADGNQAAIRAAIHQLRRHPAGLAQAVPFRLARGLGLYWTHLQDVHETLEGRKHSWEIVGRWFHLLLVLPFATVAIVAALAGHSGAGRRLRALVDIERLTPMLVMLTGWILVVAATYGSTRLRAGVEPALAVLAAIGATVVVRRARLGER